MQAMVFDGESSRLYEADLPDPAPGAGELLIDVHACGVCRTDLHVVDGELDHSKKPVTRPRDRRQGRGARGRRDRFRAR